MLFSARNYAKKSYDSAGNFFLQMKSKAPPILVTLDETSFVQNNVVKIINSEFNSKSVNIVHTVLILQYINLFQNHTKGELIGGTITIYPK